MVKTEVKRIEPDAVLIVQKYAGSGTLSEGIRVMERKLMEIKLMESTMSTPAASWIPGGNTVDGMSPEYWKRLRKEVDSIVVQYTGR